MPILASGKLTADDLATCLAGYDAACYPEASDWPYTRFFFPNAYDDGLRMVDQPAAIWNAFEEAHSAARFDFSLEIPMQYLARTVEIAFLEHTENDTPTFRFSPEIWSASVNESSYVSA